MYIKGNQNKVHNSTLSQSKVLHLFRKLIIKFYNTVCRGTLRYAFLEVQRVT